MKGLSFQNLKYDLPASIAVFFVAIPLCLGIAHASGAPLLSGLIAGIIGGLLVGILSGSHLSVTGPAAGLTAIISAGITLAGGYEQFLFAAVVAALIQIFLGLIKAGNLAEFFPNAVIRGMLSAIGIILITKELPHLLGYDVEVMGIEELGLFNWVNQLGFVSQGAESNTIELIFYAFIYGDKAVAILGISGLVLMFIWSTPPFAKLKILPGSLVVVLLSMLVLFIYEQINGTALVDASHLVSLPEIDTANLGALIITPDFSVWQNPKMFLLGLTLALVASLETLLSIEALDKLDPQSRVTPTSRELLAQGGGNLLSALIGGIPITAVIVRGSVNLAAGARSKLSAILHGLWILVAVFFLSAVINRIPFAALAAVLIYTGVKLVDIRLVAHFYKAGLSQIVPYVTTVVVVLFTDLLIGVICGLGVALALTLYEEYKSAVVTVSHQGINYRLELSERISFLHRGKIKRLLEDMPHNSMVEIDGSRNKYIDKDIIESFFDFKTVAQRRNIELSFRGISELGEGWEIVEE